jgi:predicted RNA binding protein YcfA (HicA-like mRNA interferase family)
VNKLPDLSHQRVVRAFRKAGFVVIRQSKHIAMYNEERRVVAIIPRHNPVKRTTLLRILKEVNMSPEEFQRML